MIAFIKHLLCFVLVVVLQTTLASWISFSDVVPDFILIFVVVMALRYGPVKGMLWGFFAGFSVDVYAPIEWLGAQTIAFTCIGFGVGQLEERFLTLNLATKVALLGLAFMLNDLIYYAIVGIAKDNVGMLILTNTLPGCVYTMLCSVPVFHFLYRSFGRSPNA